MFLTESIWLRQAIDKLDLTASSRILDAGSSTSELREEVQPYIEKNVFTPLRKRGFEIIHADKKSGRGVDLVIDIEKTLNVKGRFDLVICTSLLEHVRDIRSAVGNILSSVKKNGYMAVSVPFVCPYHPDPIDTMFRPSNIELEKLFLNQKILESAIVSSPVEIEGKPEIGQVSIVMLQVISPPPIKKTPGRRLWLIVLRFRNLLNKIERRRGSKNIFWRSLILAKDLSFRIYSILTPN